MQLAMTQHRGRGILIAALTAWLTATSAMAGISVRNYDIIDNPARETEAKPLHPITIVGTRNGSFSGSVVVESDAPITGLRAVFEPVAGDQAPIPAANVLVRYAIAWREKNHPGGLDILLESPPDKVAPPANGLAQVGVWVTVAAPKEMKPGTYRGQLKVEAEGLAPQAVPVELKLSDWVIPENQDWRTWMELLQSPDTLALEYELPLWSERHWEMIAKSFRLMSITGSRVVYVPLICGTNQGNEESMVRWIKQADGTFKHDYSIMEKYLDLAQQHLGQPKLVVFYAWDTSMLGTSERPKVDENAPVYGQAQQKLAQKRWDLSQQGVAVSMLDPATGQVTRDNLPRYIDPPSAELWRPVYAELRSRMKKRGWEDLMMMGMATDVTATKEQTAFLHDVSGGLSWVAHRHPGGMRGKPRPNQALHGIAEIGYEAHVYNIVYQVNPALGRLYGWQIPELRAFFGRHGIPNGSALKTRLLPEFNITGKQRGIGRVGADFWYVLKDKNGRRIGAAYARYPENMWRNLDIASWVLAPGQDGPVATARLENLREGLQECEARIFIESALLDPEKKARVGEDLAARAQAVLDQRQLAMWRTVWADEQQINQLGILGDKGNARNAPEAVWQALTRAGVKLPGFWDGPARKMRSDMEQQGNAWFVSSGWQERNRAIFEAAAEIAAKLK